MIVLLHVVDLNTRSPCFLCVGIYSVSRTPAAAADDSNSDKIVDVKKSLVEINIGGLSVDRKHRTRRYILNDYFPSGALPSVRSMD